MNIKSQNYLNDKFEVILLIIKFCSFIKLSLIVSSESNIFFSKITDNIFKVILIQSP